MAYQDKSESAFRMIYVEGRSPEETAIALGWKPWLLARMLKRRAAIKASDANEPVAPLVESRSHATERLRYEHQWREAMQAWYRSCEPEEIEKAVSSEKQGKRAERTKRSRAGDDRFLAHALRILLLLRKSSKSLTARNSENDHVETLNAQRRTEEIDRILREVCESANETPSGGTGGGTPFPEASAGNLLPS